jgi:hypothetical protein
MQRRMKNTKKYPKKMEKVSKKKGFAFSFEAIIALMLFSIMLFTLPEQTNPSLKELLILQQENDLLKVWSATNWNEQEIITDTKSIFGDNSEIWINENKILSCKERKNSIASEGTLLDSILIEKKLRIIVYYD